MAEAIAFETPSSALDPFDPAIFDPSRFPSDGFPLSAGFSCDLDFDSLDLDLDFSIDDLLQAPDDTHSASDASPDPDPDPDPDFKPAPAVSSSSSADASNSSPPSPNSDHSGVTSRECRPEGLKRKKKSDAENPGQNPSSNPRSSKFRRSEDWTSSCAVYPVSEEDEKRKARLMRNRESAQLSRQRKKHYVEELEEKVKAMNSTINDLNSKISFVMAENASLRQQLGANGNNGSQPAVYPPMGPMHFPWIPCSGYVMRPNGSHVPLIPIPRLKPQQPAPAPKAKKVESKKSEGKTKKVASISLLGLFFIALILGGFIPGFSNFRFTFDGTSDVDGVKGRILSELHGKVLGVEGRDNGLNRSHDVGAIGVNMGSKIPPDGIDGSLLKNSSESLPAFLYVPRNGKHVKINGNLIIHSVLASEKAMEKERNVPRRNGEETGWAVAGKVGSALAIAKAGRDAETEHSLYRGSSEHKKALVSDPEATYGDYVKSTVAEGPLQQWFREGLAGPILNSGMCTEVFQFEVSPSTVDSSGIIPATSAANDTDRKKIRNRRILYPDPFPLTGSTLNNTDHLSNSSQANFTGNKSVPSMVVSVLADPREVGDGDGEGMISPKKSLSHIFVVVLLDSVKYVTYSCVLPRKSPAPHLVN